MQRFSVHYTADLGRLHIPPPVEKPCMLRSQPSAAAFAPSFVYLLAADCCIRVPCILPAMQQNLV